MSPHFFTYSVIIYIILFLSSYGIKKYIKINNLGENRFESLDGFRGILAISVFIHHTVIWNQYIKFEKWETPKELFYHHLGSTSVSYFFMITSFLFINKLIKDFEKKDFDIKSFFISRVFRIIPLYYFSVFFIFIFSLIATNFNIKSIYKDIIIPSFHWGTFNIFNKIPFNNFKNTISINSSVEWSLSYEWLFYFTIPLLSIIFVKSINKKIFFAFISLAFILLFIKFHYIDRFQLYPFIGGAIAPFILKIFPNISSKIINNKIISISIILILFYVLNTDRKLVNLILNTYIFTVIALGNNIFGLLKSNILKFLGEISYSTYLLHGLIIFLALFLIIGMDNLKKINDTQYSLIIFAISPILIIISALSFKYIETPFIEIGKKFRKK